MTISKIWFSALSEYSVSESEDNYLNLRRMNFLIGPNNSGKSRLNRILCAAKKDGMKISVDEAFKAKIESMGKVFQIIKNQPNTGYSNCQIAIDAYNGECVSLVKLKNSLSELAKSFIEISSPNRSLQGAYESCYSFLKNIIDENNVAVLSGTIKSLETSVTDIKRHYIPILRGMRPLQESMDLYAERTINDYFSSESGRPDSIVTGFNLYELLVKNLLGKPEDRASIREYESILGKEFFGGQEVTLIPEYGTDTVSVKIGDDDQFPIYNLGDGLQQVIIITSAAFLEKDFSFFFIEEPEACLHPGLLKKLAIFLINHTPHQFVATTHSNHLLDLAETHNEILVHRVFKNKKGNGFRTFECTRDRALLNELGVLPSSVFLSNSTIWVEGITDRLYLKTFMRKYLSALPESVDKTLYEGFLENFHYSFVEYQGGTLGHWSFGDDLTVERLSASSLCSSAFLIADGDVSSKGDRADVLEAELGKNFHIFSAKEIENLLPGNVIVETACRIFGRKHKETKKNIDINLLSTIKETDFSLSDYGIGYVLDSCLGLPGKGRGSSVRRIFADESGTINEKVKFCHEALVVMSSIDWELPKPLSELCEKIFLHIAANN